MADVISLETVGSATTVINQGTVGPQGAVGAQGFPGLDGAAGLFVVSVSDSTTVAANSFLLADTSETDAGATYTFPASPQTGWRVRVLDVGGSVDTKPITVAGNGHDVADGGETHTISVPYAGESFVYVGETDLWQLEEKALKTQLGLSNVTNDAQVKRSEMGYPWSDVIPVTYLSPASFSVPTDRTEGFSAGVRVQANCGADGLQYGTVASSSYADPTTTVTLTMDDGDALTSNLTGVLHGNDNQKSLVNHAEQHALGGRDSLATILAAMPAHFSRVNRLAAKTVSVAADRYTLGLSTSWQRMGVNISDTGFYAVSLSDLVLSSSSVWDSTATDYTVAANRAGKDFYIYACNNSGAFKLLLSANATYPTGYSATTSRKLGGFHCLCVSAGTISGHPLSGYVAGDILPASVWDLKHRPVCAPEGMVYVTGIGKWVDIYLASISSGALASIYGATCADGTSSTIFDWYDFTEWFGRIGKHLPDQGEFMVLANGSNEGTNITGSADPGTTGGKVDTASRRMISNCGCEDCCGNLWQWLREAGGPYNTTTSFIDQYTLRSSQRGRGYNVPNRGIAGGAWDAGASCGSRGSFWSYPPLNLTAILGARGVAEPLAVAA